MPIWKPSLVLLALVGLTASCASNRPTLLGHWPPAVSAAPAAQTSDYGQGVPKGSAAAARWFRVEAERGVPEAQFNLGVMYARGEGLERDPEQAVRWLRRAESQGVRQAQAQLGGLYALGDAPDASPEEAERWLLAAAHAGNSGAQTALAERYASLESRPPRPTLPRADQPLPQPTPPVVLSPEEQLALGDRYRAGDGVQRDFLYAARLYARAAEAGFSTAQARLGEAYREGVGVPRDYVLAYKWLSLAAAAGTAGARDGLEDVESRLTTERVLEAQALARDWYDQHVASTDRVAR